MACQVLFWEKFSSGIVRTRARSRSRGPSAGPEIKDETRKIRVHGPSAGLGESAQAGVPVLQKAPVALCALGLLTRHVLGGIFL